MAGIGEQCDATLLQKDIASHTDASECALKVLKFQPQICFNEFRKNQKYTDALIVSEDNREFWAHKLILVARCPRFKHIIEMHEVC